MPSIAGMAGQAFEDPGEPGVGAVASGGMQIGGQRWTGWPMAPLYLRTQRSISPLPHPIRRAVGGANSRPRIWSNCLRAGQCAQLQTLDALEARQRAHGGEQHRARISQPIDPARRIRAERQRRWRNTDGPEPRGIPGPKHHRQHPVYSRQTASGRDERGEASVGWDVLAKGTGARGQRSGHRCSSSSFATPVEVLTSRALPGHNRWPDDRHRRP